MGKNIMEVKQRILVVDDNLPQRIIHESYLKELGYEVELAEDGFAAMASEFCLSNQYLSECFSDCRIFVSSNHPSSCRPTNDQSRTSKSH